MRVAIVHGRYRQLGGEDNVVEQEMELLQSRGVEVVPFIRDNSSFPSEGSARVAIEAIWSRGIAAEFDRFLRSERPDIIHVHNTFPFLSPAVFSVADRQNIPAVLTLHNYRLLCPAATLFRNGSPCEDCVSRSWAWPAVSHGCYRESRAATAAVAAINSIHQALGTWTRSISAYIALTDFARDVYERGGLPPDRLHVRPNYVSDPTELASAVGDARARAMFIGRISEEKGVRILTREWQKVGAPLDVYGDGPLLEDLRKSSPAGIRFHGFVGRDRALEAMRGAAFLVVPSIWYEAFPLVVLEAFSLGVPVLASNVGSLSEVVQHELTGLHFEPDRTDSLAHAAIRLLKDRQFRERLGANARAAYLARYTPEIAYKRLLDIYETARIASHRSISSS